MSSSGINSQRKMNISRTNSVQTKKGKKKKTRQIDSQQGEENQRQTDVQTYQGEEGERQTDSLDEATAPPGGGTFAFAEIQQGGVVVRPSLVILLLHHGVW